jgi:hypothetical protein
MHEPVEIAYGAELATLLVIPATAGKPLPPWIPAFAGMTGIVRYLRC